MYGTNGGILTSEAGVSTIGKNRPPWTNNNPHGNGNSDSEDEDSESEDSNDNGNRYLRRGSNTISTKVTTGLETHKTIRESHGIDPSRATATVDQALSNSSSGVNTESRSEVPANGHFLLSIHTGFVLFVGLGLLVVAIRNQM